MTEDSGNPTSSRRSRLMVGGYEILSKIGQGGMAAVFEARQVATDRVVALKVLTPRLAKNEEFVARFMREAQMASRLEHPNIVRAVDVGRAGIYYYFAMEFVRGRNLGDILKDGRMDQRRALEIARDVARALACAHEAGLVHRDVKPTNILVTADGTVKLADLGLARETVRQNPAITQAGMALGTPFYISPEQVLGKGDLDGRCDIYSLGATLYHLLTGTVPFMGKTGAEVMSMHLTAPTPDPRSANEHLPESVAVIVRRAMARDREARYSTARMLLEDIDSALAGGGPAQTAEQPAQRRLVPRWALGAGAAAVALVLSGIMVAALTRSDGTQRPADLEAEPARASSSHRMPGPESTEPDSPAVAVDPAAADRALLASARTWVENHPGELREAVRVYTEAIRKMTDDGVVAEAREALAQVQARRMAEADQAWRRIEQQALSLAEGGDYDAALLLLADPLPDEYSDVLADRVEQTAGRLHREAEAEVAAGIASAEDLSKGGNPAEALGELDKLAAVRYAPRTADVAELRIRLEAEMENTPQAREMRRQEQAHDAFASLLRDIRVAVDDGDLAHAARLGQAALADETLKPLAAKVQRVADVTELMPEIPVRRDIWPLKTLRELQGQEVAFETESGTRRGTVRHVTDEQITLVRTFSINRELHERKEVVPIADLLPDTRKTYKLDWTPQTDEEAAAAAIIDSSSERTGSGTNPPPDYRP